MFYLAALEGQRRVLGEEHKATFASLGDMGIILKKMGDYEGPLVYYQQALRVQQKVLGKTHPDTLRTIINMGMVYGDGLGDRAKDKEMQRLALDGREKSLGNFHEDMKQCARNLAILLAGELEDKAKTRDLAKRYPHILTETICVPALLRGEYDYDDY